MPKRMVFATGRIASGSGTGEVDAFMAPLEPPLEFVGPVPDEQVVEVMESETADPAGISGSAS